MTLSRRHLLGTAGGLLSGVLADGLVGATEKRPPPGTGGTLRFATRAEPTGLDPHRHVIYPVSMPLAATSQGLLDLNEQCEPVPGVAAAWEAAADLRIYTFTLRPGVLFHNGREVDAAAVQWNLERLKNPRTASAFARAALENLREIEVLDKYTVRCHLRQPSAAFPADVVYYPCALMAPDSEAQADTRPMGCGPFKFVRWERTNVMELARFEHYFETDASGRSLPYLERILGSPKKEDAVRLTSLRAGEVELIDSMAYTEAAQFARKYASGFQSWPIPTVGTAFLTFNLTHGPFTDKRLRQAAAHAVDRAAIHQAVFYGLGEIAGGFYATASPWHAPAIRPAPAYDPEQARFLLRQARALGTAVVLQADDAFPYLQHTATILQAMWTEVGFKVHLDLYSAPILRQKRRARDFHAEVTAASYRFDPDGWFSRHLHSASPSTQEHSGFHHLAVDRLIATARQTAERPQRLTLYSEIDSLVNEELPLLYLHHVPLLQAGRAQLYGYHPAIAGIFSIRHGGVRTAWLA
jgi:peptide/nickel transport system substrate-binding protein